MASESEIVVARVLSFDHGGAVVSESVSVLLSAVFAKVARGNVNRVCGGEGNVNGSARESGDGEARLRKGTVRKERRNAMGALRARLTSS